jgi:hypothetical protein
MMEIKAIEGDTVLPLRRMVTTIWKKQTPLRLRIA